MVTPLPISPSLDLDQTRLDWLVGSDRQVEDIYPLSPMQDGMLFHSLLDGDSGEYVEQSITDLPGDLNVKLFRQAWDRLVERHPVLRTVLCGPVWTIPSRLSASVSP